MNEFEGTALSNVSWTSFPKETLQLNTLARAIRPDPSSIDTARRDAGRVKIHVTPDENVKEALLASKLSFLEPSDVFLECFYDNGLFDLLSSGCWLRSRQVLRTDEPVRITSESLPSSPVEWVWHKQSYQLEGVHVYDEFPATTDESLIKSYMVATIPDLRYELSLREIFPRFVARFVTARYRLSDAACIDRTFFDETGEQTYDVYTFCLGQDPLALPLLTPVPTKVMEYLRHFRPTLHQRVHLAEGPEKEEKDYEVKLVNDDPGLPGLSAFGKDELPWPTTAQLAHIPDPRNAWLHQQTEDYARKRQAILGERFNDLCHTPGHRDKWVVITEASKELRHVAGSELEAYKWKSSHAKEDDPMFVAHVTGTHTTRLVQRPLPSTCTSAASVRHNQPNRGRGPFSSRHVITDVL